jgi:transcription antitermination factor NusG
MVEEKLVFIEVVSGVHKGKRGYITNIDYQRDRVKVAIYEGTKQMRVYMPISATRELKSRVEG